MILTFQFTPNAVIQCVAYVLVTNNNHTQTCTNRMCVKMRNTFTKRMTDTAAIQLYCDVVAMAIRKSDALCTIRVGVRAFV